MFLTIIIALLGFVALLIVHEFGHFIVAKKCGVCVEEFGVGYPPRIIGKKIRGTIYSLNLIPFGAFVKIKGETGGIEDYQSFAGKPIIQRAAIVLGGVVSFWLAAIVLLSLVAGIWGMPVAVSDDSNLDIIDPKIQITGIVEGSPAEKAGLRAGDIIQTISFLDADQKNVIASAEKVSQVQALTLNNKGKEIVLTVERGDKLLDLSIIPRISYPEGEGPLGIVLIRVALKPYSWSQAPVEGLRITGILTANIINGWILGAKSALGISELPSGVNFELRGPLGIFDLLREYFARGLNYFLYLIALIAIVLALVNILPIPALDGGKLVFLAIEWVRKKPISPKIEQTITSSFFVVLIAMMLYVTVRYDIPRLFF